MSNSTQTVGLVLAAATLSIVLATQMQAGPSLLRDNRPAMPGLDAWQKSVMQNAQTLGGN